MTTKNKKRASIKKAVILAPRIKPFDLTKAPTEAEQVRQIGALKALQVTEGWILLRMTLEAQIADIDVQIINKSSRDGVPLTDAECDRLREQRSVMQGLVDKPKLLLGELERVEEDEPEDDPYEGRPARSRHG